MVLCRTPAWLILVWCVVGGILFQGFVFSFCSVQCGGGVLLFWALWLA